MDPSYLQDNRVAPYAIKYSALKPLSFKARHVPVVFATSNQSTYSQANNLIKIPVNSSTAFLDGPNSFIKLKFKNNQAVFTQKFNNSAHSLIEHLRVLTRGSEPLENIQNYDKVHSVMSDLLLSPENRYVRQEQGYGNHTIPALPDGSNAAAVLAAVQAAAANQQCLNELTVAPNGEVTLCIPLELSCTVGGAQQKLLPLWMMGEVLVEIQLNKDCVFNLSGGADAGGDGGLGARRNTQLVFQVSEVEFHASLIEFDSSVNMALTSMAAGDSSNPGLGLNLSGCTWTNSMISLAVGQNTLTNNERLRSLKSLFMSFIPNGLTYADRKAGRHNNAITQIQYKFGSQYLPSYPIRGDSASSSDNGEYVVELLKAASEYGNSMHTGLINCDSFANVGNANTDCGRAVFGIDCDAFGREHVESGLSTVENTPITVQWSRPGAGAIAQDVYLFLYHDVIFNVLPNGLVTRSVM